MTLAKTGQYTTAIGLLREVYEAISSESCTPGPDLYWLGAYVSERSLRVAIGEFLKAVNPDD